MVCIRQVSQHASVGHSSMSTKLIPQVFNLVQVWNHGKPFHSLLSNSLGTLVDPGSVGASQVSSLLFVLSLVPPSSLPVCVYQTASDMPRDTGHREGGTH